MHIFSFKGSLYKNVSAQSILQSATHSWNMVMDVKLDAFHLDLAVRIAKRMNNRNMPALGSFVWLWHFPSFAKFSLGVYIPVQVYAYHTENTSQLPVLKGLLDNWTMIYIE